MPYITPDKREVLDKHMEALVADFQKISQDGSTAGNINYFVSALLSKLYPEIRYGKVNEAIGALECIKLEWYRKVAADYEDVKEAENGPVHPRNF